MRIVNDDRPVCDICSATKRSDRADFVITVEPIIKQTAKGPGTEIYLCNKHQRLMMKTIDKMVDNTIDS